MNSVTYLDIAGANWVDTGTVLPNDVWNKVALDWNHSTSQLTVTINGGTPIDVTGYGTATSVDRFEFRALANNYDPADWFVDGPLTVPTPEPGALVLLATGLIGLLAYAWRRRR